MDPAFLRRFRSIIHLRLPDDHTKGRLIARDNAYWDGRVLESKTYIVPSFPDADFHSPFYKKYSDFTSEERGCIGDIMLTPRWILSAASDMRAKNSKEEIAEDEELDNLLG